MPKRVVAAAIANGFDPTDVAELIPAAVENAVGVPGAFATVPGMTPAIEAAVAQAFKDAYAYAFRRVVWSSIPFGVIAIICACFIKDPSMYLTNHTAIHMEREGVLGRANGEHAPAHVVTENEKTDKRV